MATVSPRKTMIMVGRLQKELDYEDRIRSLVRWIMTSEKRDDAEVAKSGILSDMVRDDICLSEMAACIREMPESRSRLLDMVCNAVDENYGVRTIDSIDMLLDRLGMNEYALRKMLDCSNWYLCGSKKHCRRCLSLVMANVNLWRAIKDGGSRAVHKLGVAASKLNISKAALWEATISWMRPSDVLDSFEYLCSVSREWNDVNWLSSLDELVYQALKRIDIQRAMNEPSYQSRVKAIARFCTMQFSGHMGRYDRIVRVFHILCGGHPELVKWLWEDVSSQLVFDQKFDRQYCRAAVFNSLAKHGILGADAA